MSTVPLIDLNDGKKIPQLGFGVFQIEPENTASTLPSRRLRTQPSSFKT